MCVCGVALNIVVAMAHAVAKGPVTRSTAGLEAKKSLFDKGNLDSVVKVKTDLKE